MTVHQDSPAESLTVRAPTAGAMHVAHTPARVRHRLKLLAAEPLVHFALSGLLLCLVVHAWNSSHGRTVIHVSAPQRELLAQRYRQQFGAPPSPSALEASVDDYVREEILVREAVALGLDRDDEIIRRRLLQKFEFLQSDMSALPPPPAAVLERWYEQHRTRYLIPERVALSQVYVSPDTDGVQESRLRALDIRDRLQTLHVARAPELGDRFPGPQDVSDLSPDDARRLFGESELAEQLFSLPSGQWAGPFRSGYGWHLVYVSSHQPATLPSWPSVRERVLADYLEDEQRLANQRRYEELERRYTIHDDGKPAQADGSRP